MHKKEKYTEKVIKLLPPNEFLARAINVFKLKPLGSEHIEVEDSLSRILAEDVVSKVDIPASNKSAMDGYAIRAEDTLNAGFDNWVRLKVVGKQFLTDFDPPVPIGEGEAYQVVNGSTVPDGSDAVVRLEQVRAVGNNIEINRSLRIWENVEKRGADIKKGDLVLHGGKKISPYDIGLLIAIGLRQVSVTRKPKVGILSVGEELKEIDSLEHGKVVNNYTYIVSALISEFGAVPIMLGIASDNLEEIKGSIKSHINDLDVILTIGGCSVGEKDLVADAIKSLGAPGLIVHGVKAVVLKVAGYGSINGKPIVMLPGPVISAVGTFYVFVLPLLNILRGQDLYSYPLIFRAELEEEIRGKSGMGVFKLLELSLKNGKFSAKPLKGGTNLLSNLVKANAYTIVEAGRNQAKGQMVDVAICGHLPVYGDTPPSWLK